MNRMEKKGGKEFIDVLFWLGEDSGASHIVY